MAAVQLLFCRCRPQDSTIKDTAILVSNIRRIQCAESDFLKWHVLLLPNLPLLLLPDKLLHGKGPEKNKEDYFIAHKFSSIHFWTSFSLTLTRRALLGRGLRCQLDFYVKRCIKQLRLIHLYYKILCYTSVCPIADAISFNLSMA